MLLIAAVFMSWRTAEAGAQPTLQQFKAWLIYYTNNDIRADYNYDGRVTPTDFNAFLVNYNNPPTNEGWTNLSPSADSRVIYVSSSQGNDSNDGRSQNRPVRTIQKAYDLIRDGKPDWVSLRRGDTFYESLPNWKKSGRSKSEPMVITAYGTSTVRPKILTGSARGMRATGPDFRKHIYFVGLELHPHTRSHNDAPGGIEFICDFQDILIEDCKITGYADNLQFQAPKGDVGTDVRVRRSVIANSWAVGQHSQGLYAARVDGLLIEGSVFDHNGWSETVNGAEPTIFNHNIYVQTSCDNLTVRDNIISNASSHGLQARPGGTVTGNLFYRNSISVLLGNEDERTTGRIEDNIILEGKDISPDLRRGMGIHVQFVDQAKIRNNVILRNGTDTGLSEAIALIGDNDQPITNLLVEYNVIYNWLNNIVIENESTRDMIFRFNVVYDNANESPAIRHFDESTLNDVLSYNNTYYVGGTSNWFRARNRFYNLNEWVNLSNESNPISINGRSFVDSTRTLTRYAQYQLLPANPQLVLNRAKAQTRLNWDEAYSAPAIVEFFKAGYTLTN
ncbi:MAG: right-handed parallel beta-helix repeat-containing protein [Phycisphaera sp.]|nr:MAG: right-handed parallel beta-helix repeat-containing protein [Phycisphaera sp.]